MAASVFTSWRVAEDEMMSPIDEYRHMGHFAAVADEGILRRGVEMPLS